MELSFRLAEASDIDEVIKLSDGIYNGHDYLPVVFHQWLQMEHTDIMLAHSGSKLIGLASSCIVDDGRTLIHRANRILPELRGQGLLRNLSRALDEYIQENFPKVSLQRLNAFADLSSKAINPYRRVLEQEILSYRVEKKTSTWEQPLITESAKLQINSCTREYLSDVILSPTMIKRLFPHNVLLFDWCPFEPRRSNVDLIQREHDLHLFVDKCSVDAWPSSFSHGIYAQRVKAVEWQATVYTDDPHHFEAHLLHQYKCACELIHGKFTFFTFQDKSMTAVARRVLEDKLQLEMVNVYNNEIMKVYERGFPLNRMGDA